MKTLLSEVVVPELADLKYNLLYSCPKEIFLVL